MVRWGFLGAGRVAAEFAQGLKQVPDAVISHVASQTAARAEHFSRLFGGTACTQAELLGSDVDVIYVCTPNQLHARQAIAALEAGKAVLVEKPFALTAAEAREIAQAAEKAQKFCMEAVWSRFMPAWVAAREAARVGTLGDIRLVEASLGFPIAITPGNRVYDPKMGGGALYDLGVYAVHAVHSILGTPAKVTAEQVVGQTGVDETILATLHYPHGVFARISSSVRHGCRNDLAVYGSNASLILDGPLFRPESLSITPVFATVDDGSKVSAPSRLGALKQRGEVRAAVELLRSARRTKRLPAIGNGYAHEILEVHQCLSRGARQSDVVPLHESVSVMETMDRIREAAAR